MIAIMALKFESAALRLLSASLNRRARRPSSIYDKRQRRFPKIQASCVMPKHLFFIGLTRHREIITCVLFWIATFMLVIWRASQFSANQRQYKHYTSHINSQHAARHFSLGEAQLKSVVGHHQQQTIVETNQFSLRGSFFEHARV